METEGNVGMPSEVDPTKAVETKPPRRMKAYVSAQVRWPDAIRAIREIINKHIDIGDVHVAFREFDAKVLESMAKDIRRYLP